MADIVAPIVQCTLIVINIIFAIIGIGAIAHGISTEGLVLQAVIAALGGIIFITSFFGCFGAMTENRCMIITYTVLLLLIIFTEAAIGGIVFEHSIMSMGLDRLIYSVNFFLAFIVMVLTGLEVLGAALGLYMCNENKYRRRQQNQHAMEKIDLEHFESMQY